MRDWKNFFTAEDFDGLDDNNRPRTKWLTDRVAEQANALLRPEVIRLTEENQSLKKELAIHERVSSLIQVEIPKEGAEKIMGANSEFTG